MDDGEETMDADDADDEDCRVMDEKNDAVDEKIEESTDDETFCPSKAQSKLATSQNEELNFDENVRQMLKQQKHHILNGADDYMRDFELPNVFVVKQSAKRK
jgi:hypothetical protein